MAANTNPENVLFAEWQTAPEDGKSSVMEKLLPRLRQHAGAVCWSILHQRDDALENEMVDDLRLRIDKFNGKSLFSSWVHACFRNRCVSELRRRRHFTGLSQDIPTPSPFSAVDRRVLVEQIIDAQDHLDKALLQHLLQGGSCGSAQHKFHVSESTIRTRLKKIAQRFHKQTAVSHFSRV